MASGQGAVSNDSKCRLPSRSFARGEDGWEADVPRKGDSFLFLGAGIEGRA